MLKAHVTGLCINTRQIFTAERKTLLREHSDGRKDEGAAEFVWSEARRQEYIHIQKHISLVPKEGGSEDYSDKTVVFTVCMKYFQMFNYP